MIINLRQTSAPNSAPPKSLVQQSAVLPTPAEGEWFELEVDHDLDPMSVVTSAAGITDAAKWQYLGPKFLGKRTYRAKLIRLGRVDNLAQARAAARARNPNYRLLEGQAREPFKAKYPHHNRGSVAFGGSEWRDQGGQHRLASLYGLLGLFWTSSFGSVIEPFGEGWLWAVVEEPDKAVVDEVYRVDRSDEEVDAS